MSRSRIAGKSDFIVTKAKILNLRNKWGSWLGFVPILTRNHHRAQEISLRQRRNVWERERDRVDRRRADIHKGGREGVEGGEEKTSVEVKPHCYLNSRARGLVVS